MASAHGHDHGGGGGHGHGGGGGGAGGGGGGGKGISARDAAILVLSGMGLVMGAAFLAHHEGVATFLWIMTANLLYLLFPFWACWMCWYKEFKLLGKGGRYLVRFTAILLFVWCWAVLTIDVMVADSAPNRFPNLHALGQAAVVPGLAALGTLLLMLYVQGKCDAWMSTHHEAH